MCTTSYGKENKRDFLLYSFLIRVTVNKEKKMNPQYNKLENETDYEYGLRLISIKVEEKPDDLDWEDIVSLLKLDCHRDSLRKAANVTDYSGYKVMQYFKEKLESKNCDDSDSYMKELELKKQQLIKEREKLHTEKLEYNRWLREDARDELFEEKIISAIKETLGKVDPPHKIGGFHTSRFGLLNFADCHFGKEFKVYGLNNDIINAYSPEIFFMRMEVLFNEVIDYARKENLTSFKIFNLGDALDGFLRHSQLWTLRYGVPESAVIFGEFMGKWLYALSEEFNIEYYQTCGNHGELRLLDGRKGEHTNDNIEVVTGGIIKIINEDNPNFTFVENKSGFIFTDIAGYNVMGIHGEVKNLANAIKEYSDIYGINIDYLVAGHRHHSHYENCGVRRGVIGVGSIVGSDDYSMSIRKASDATASFVIFEKGKGKVDEHTFILN